MTVAERRWLPEASKTLIRRVTGEMTAETSATLADRIDALAERNRAIHERACFNLNPATNVMNPRAEALLASGLGMRPSLGAPGDKYETGLEAVEEIEILATTLACEVFGAAFAELRVASGAIANLYAFMALAQPGDAIIAPPGEIGGHVTHHAAGCAGLYGLTTHAAPVNADDYTVDLDALARLAREVRPRIITLGGSLNLWPHPVAEVRAIADEVGASLMFDAAHQCGIIAGGAWENPLDHGADLMTMSTYKSLGGPPSGLLVTNDAAIAERLDAIAFPGMTANFDASKTAALAMSLLDWRDFGAAYAQEMIAMAQALSSALQAEGLAVHGAAIAPTLSHQFALEAAPLGGGQAAAQTLRRAGFLACGIGLPGAPVPGDMNGLRLGTPELVRWGMTAADAPRLAKLIAEALRANDPESLAPEVAAWRQSFDRVHFVHG
ncbi:aminotransferase class I/II-fold pyridoxal phosphate-dependent enzyme [Salipiger sp. P9]|uniref:serine hydroxymethyltransferase n=1 Tax=Salipiger pentaromativorans TaxID=2943193 RepID=UPI0021580CE0|nr:aminotransferase class I/II-fold pyridoxal phosphate-dependent enzyme [Salipiger pentaromativorans]MCR8548091.1 aminotransferase class I/II-fold pyridoxal phosphate-dependent enzyme [Salipiger pentaromativorans]